MSCVSGVDAPIKPYALTKRRNAEYFCKTPPEQRGERRRQMLEATPEALRALSDDVKRIANDAPACVFAGRDVIEASNANWNVVDLLSDTCDTCGEEA